MAVQPIQKEIWMVLLQELLTRLAIHYLKMMYNLHIFKNRSSIAFRKHGMQFGMCRCHQSRLSSASGTQGCPTPHLSVIPLRSGPEAAGGGCRRGRLHGAAPGRVDLDAFEPEFADFLNFHLGCYEETAFQEGVLVQERAGPHTCRFSIQPG